MLKAKSKATVDGNLCKHLFYEHLSAEEGTCMQNTQQHTDTPLSIIFEARFLLNDPVHI